MTKAAEKLPLLDNQETGAALSRLPAVTTPMELLERAVQSGATVESLEKLMGLQERYETNQARKAFDNAMASAKAEIPIISKNREVDFTSAKGRTNYKYEDLAEVARTVNPILAKYGLSYRYRTTSVVNEPVTVTCVVSHRDGHFEENTLAAARDDTGNKNGIQSIGSTLTYLQRMTLKAALGLAAAADDDAAGSEPHALISDEQFEALRDLVDSVGASAEKFCQIFRVDGIAMLPASRYDEATLRLKQYGKTQGKVK